MISKIHIEALKSIHDLTVECSKLNLIVGTNSSGKSTFLQAILLEAQNSLSDMGLNGKLISLGEFREVRNYNMPNSDIQIEIWEDGKIKPAWIKFAEDKEKLDYTLDRSEQNEDISRHISYESGFHYLSCHRIGAKDIYEKNMLNSSDFGIDGEYTLAYLLKHQEEPVNRELLVGNEGVTDMLIDQVNYWLKYIVGATLEISDLKKTNYLQVKYNNNPDNVSFENMYCRPVNVGSGISYLVSILITCLASKKNDIIIIENPEIHLHPKAQSRLSEFLHFISQSDRQLFIETHSDHIFNGLRAGVAQGKIRQEDIKVDFFALDDNYETQCNPVVFGLFGKITGTNEEMDIKDLFDQFEIDMDKMLGL